MDSTTLTRQAHCPGSRLREFTNGVGGAGSLFELLFRVGRLGGFCSWPYHRRSTSAHGVNGNWSSAKNDQREGDGRQRQWQLITSLAEQAIFPVDFPDGYRHVDQDCEREEPRQQSGNHTYPAEDSANADR